MAVPNAISVNETVSGTNQMRREFPDAPIVGVGAVILDGDRVLLVRRGQEPLKGEWSLPGGAVELGESLEEAVRREVAEETCLAVEPTDIIEVLSSIQRDHRGAVRYHFVIVDFLCRVIGGESKCGSDADEVRWISYQELESDGEIRVTAAVYRVIRKALTNTKV